MKTVLVSFVVLFGIADAGAAHAAAAQPVKNIVLVHGAFAAMQNPLTSFADARETRSSPSRMPRRATHG